MPTLTEATQRLELNQSSRVPTLEFLSGKKLVFWQGLTARIECALFNDTPGTTSLVNISNVASANIVVRKNGPSGLILFTEETTDFTSITYSEWLAETAQHFVFDISELDTTQIVPEAGRLPIYFVVTLITNDAVPFIAGFGYGEIADVGYIENPVSSDYVTGRSPIVGGKLLTDLDLNGFRLINGLYDGPGYKETGSVGLTAGQLEVVIPFVFEKVSNNYRVYLNIEDPNIPPEDIRAVVNSRAQTGFTVELSAAPNTNLSTLFWNVVVIDDVPVGTAPPKYIYNGSLRNLLVGPVTSSPMAGTISNLFGASYWSSTNSTQPNPLISFAGPSGNSNSLNAFFMTATWNAVATQKGYTLTVENIVPADAPSYGAAAAIYGGLLNYRQDTDGAGIIGVINNVAGHIPVGAAIWALVRGPNASAGPVDGVRSTSETDGAEHPQYGMIVNNSTANNAFKFGFIVAGAVDFGFCCGLGSNSAAEVVPTYPFAYRRKTDGQIRFNVGNTGIITGPKLSVLDADVWGVPWHFIQRNDGVLKVSYGGEDVIGFVSLALGGPFIELDLVNQPSRAGFSGFRCGFGTDICRRASDGALALFAQNGLTVINGTIEITNLPTSDPHAFGKLWRSGADPKVSLG